MFLVVCRVHRGTSPRPTDDENRCGDTQGIIECDDFPFFSGRRSGRFPVAALSTNWSNRQPNLDQSAGDLGAEIHRVNKLTRDPTLRFWL